MSTVREEVEGTIDKLAGKAHQAADAAAKLAHEATDKTAGALGAAGARAHDMGSAVVDAARRTGASVKASADEVSGFIRRHPVPAILIAMGMGYMLARITRV